MSHTQYYAMFVQFCVVSRSQPTLYRHSTYQCIYTLRKKCSSRTFSPLTSTLAVMCWKVPLNNYKHQFKLLTTMTITASVAYTTHTHTHTPHTNSRQIARALQLQSEYHYTICMLKMSTPVSTLHSATLSAVIWHALSSNWYHYVFYHLFWTMHIQDV